MNNLGQNNQLPGSKKSTHAATNPFARALAETEKGAYSKQDQAQSAGLNPFSEALARAGGNLPTDFSPQDFSPEDMLAEQQKLAEQQRKAEMRKKLHDQVNPVDQTDIFSARRERTKKELEDVRKELKALASEISKFYKEVDIQTTLQITEQGNEGTGLKTYYQKLKAFIVLLTKKVRSARTWMQQQQSISAKKKRKIKGGLMMQGGGVQETKTVFDMMHHERGSTYSGG